MSDQIIIPVVMPKFGLAMTEGKIAFWNIEEGSNVSLGDELADIETSKITNGYESPASGVLRRQLATAGETYSVGALIGIIADPAVPDTEIDAFIAQFKAPDAGSEDDGGGAKAPEPKTVTVNGQAMRILDLGPPDTAPVVLIHGFGGDLNSWLFLQEPLAAKQRVIALDLPGHGGSDKNIADGSKAGLAKAVLDCLDVLGIERAHLVGHSLGAAVSLAAALLMPARVASLSLIAPAGLGKEINMGFINGFVEANRAREMEAVLRLLFANKDLVSRDMVQDIIRFKRLDGALDGLRNIIAANFSEDGQIDLLLEALGSVSVPVQVIWGENDEIIPATQAAKLPSTVTVHLIPKAGHMPQMEQAAEVNPLLTAFLQP